MNFQHIEEECKNLIAIEQHIERLYALKNTIVFDNMLNYDIALESEFILNSNAVLYTYYSDTGTEEKVKIALEEIDLKITAMIVAGFISIIAVIVKLINFLRGSKSDTVRKDKDTVKEAKEIISDPELTKAIVTALYEADHISMESYPTVTINDVFNEYKESLNESEVDFLTTGQRYMTTKETINEFTRGNFSEFIKNINADITTWSESGLKDSAYVGKDDSIVQKFVLKTKNKLKEIQTRYYSTTSNIEEMNERCSGVQMHGDYNKLHMFCTKPSALFPHITTLWKDIKFEAIDEDDKELIASLEGVKKKIENEANKIKDRSEQREHAWPAEEAMIKLAYSAYRDIVQNITSLVRVSGFIKSSTNTAYRATEKSFTYISRMLSAISKMPNIDHAKLKQCIGVIQTKRKEFTNIVHSI